VFFKRKKDLRYPRVMYAGREYYEVSLAAVKGLEKVRVKVSGKVSVKPIIKYYSAGFPWSLEARVEENHGHETVFEVEGVTIVFNGVVFLRKGEEVTVYGEVRDCVVYAEAVETSDVVYVKE